MIRTTHVEGQDRGRVVLYALSTCAWCRKAKQFLTDRGVAFEFIFVDLLGREERKEVEQEVRRWNPRCSYPTLVFRDKTCIVGFHEDDIARELES